MNVRAEAVSSWPAVRTVHLAAFRGNGKVVASLVDDLRDAVARGEGLSLVAEERGEIVGHVMFSPSCSTRRSAWYRCRVLSPIGVVPTWQNKGVGTTLIGRGLEMLAERNLPLVFLEGSPTY